MDEYQANDETAGPGDEHPIESYEYETAEELKSSPAGGEPWQVDMPGYPAQPKPALGYRWLLEAFVYPCFSADFYRAALQRRLASAVLFFFLFALILTLISTARVGVAMSDFGDELDLAFQQGDFPRITIADGIASVDEPQPLILSDTEDGFVAIDTTGAIEEIDTRAYRDGILLTRTQLHFYNEGDYQTYLLSDFHAAFGDPIVIDEEQVSDWWNVVGPVFTLFAFFGLIIWNLVVRFAFLALVGLPVWGFTAAVRQGTGYSPILITGIFANVPAIYAHWLLGQINISFCGLYTLLLVVTWAVALRASLK